MENPIVKTRRKLGINRNVLALMAGMCYSSVAANERGLLKEPSESILKVFSKLGHDPEEIREEYKEWREEKRPAVIA